MRRDIYLSLGVALACSACLAEPQSGVMTDFCPNCGADMRGKRNG